MSRSLIVPRVATSTPLFTRLLSHIKSRPVQFHIPAHKGGHGMDPDFHQFVGNNALSMDLINIDPLDDLQHPRGVIREAEELAAEAFHADHTLFSVQGTSTAIMAMIMAVCGPGDKILVPRNAHKSVMSALILAGAVPVFLDPEIDPKIGVAHGVRVETVETTLSHHTDAKAVLIVNPSYFGICVDLAGIVHAVHAWGIPILVDEAHGPHLYFHDQMPLSAMDAGADAAACSMHKLGGSMTQSSVLNLQGTLICAEQVRFMLNLLTTTSTSYLLLSSLDAARRHMMVHGSDLLDRTLNFAQSARKRINNIHGIHCFGKEVTERNSAAFDWDPTKLCITVKDLGMTGREMEQILREEFRIEVELSDLYNILCFITIGDTQSQVNYLIESLNTIADRNQPSQPIQLPTAKMGPHCMALPPREAVYAASERVPRAQAVGRTIAESVLVYPPGIPLLVPGEVVTQDDVAYIEEHQRLGYRIQGPADDAIDFVKCVV